MKKKSKGITALICVFLVCCIGGGGYYGRMKGWFNPGNRREYSVKNTAGENSVLRGKTVIFLGSSVTYGFAAGGESFVDYLAKETGLIAVKEAVSGTTLVDDKSSSYISRMKTIDKNIRADAFVCQLSTNDAAQGKPLGRIADGSDISDFDTHTVIGAMEYIIAYAKQTWQCPVVFYTGTRYDSEAYEKMVGELLLLRRKWDIGVIDLWHNEAMNSIDAATYRQYMNDGIHPTRRGYKEWWTPVFRAYLEELL